ncbi:MAG: replicative DNA helicase [Oscillospiraceae bacterium]|nr:replicative DNA helicase [Oscillospiraceae bacterium]
MATDNTFPGLDSIAMPFSVDAEQAVLGSVLIDGACMTQVQAHLRPEYFYLPQHQSIFGVMVAIEASGGKIDPLLVLERLKADNVYDDAGGKNYLYQLAEAVPSTKNVEQYAKIVREKYYLRALINTSREIIDDTVSADADADLLLDSAEQKIYDIRRGKTTSAPSRLSDIILNEVYDKLTKLNSPEKDEYKGFPTGYADLDGILTGLHKSDLILIGARPAMGKTSIALNLARNVSLLGKKKVVFFSLEMTKEQLAQRVLSTEARVHSQKMRTGELDADDWTRLGLATSVLNECELYFDDSTNITVPEMKAKVRRLRDADCVIVDYLGLVQSATRKENRVQEVTEITRSLKMMAKDLRIPVVCCAQLSRGTEGRGKSHRPQLADLRDSGSIEQDADIVLMLYRPEYYSAEKPDEDREAEENAVNEVEIIVAKNRHGPTGTVKLVWDAEHTQFVGIEKIRY